MCEKLNQLIETRDITLTSGLLFPALKPGKKSTDPASYRPIILLSTWRKLLSLIVLNGIRDQLEQVMNRSQHAYVQNMGTGDVILAHKFMIAASIEKEFEPLIVGIDMSPIKATPKKTQ